MDHPDRRMEVPADNKAAPARRFDRTDGLILAAATITAMLGVPWPLRRAASARATAAIAGHRDASAAGPFVAAPSPAIAACPRDAFTGRLCHGRAPAAGRGSRTRCRRTYAGTLRPYLMAWTLAILILGLRRPVHFGAVFRQPGIAACGGATLILAVQLSVILLRWAVEWSWVAAVDAWASHRVVSLGAAPAVALQDLWLSIRAGFIESACAGHAIAGAWLIMALGGWWRPERSAVDRLGRALGAAWIAVMAARVVREFR